MRRSSVPSYSFPERFFPSVSPHCREPRRTGCLVDDTSFLLVSSHRTSLEITTPTWDLRSKASHLLRRHIFHWICPAVSKRKYLNDWERGAVIRYLLAGSNNRVLQRGAFTVAAEEFGCEYKSIKRLWRRYEAQCVAGVIEPDLSTNRKGRSDPALRRRQHVEAAPCREDRAARAGTPIPKLYYISEDSWTKGNAALAAVEGQGSAA